MPLSDSCKPNWALGSRCIRSLAACTAVLCAVALSSCGSAQRADGGSGPLLQGNSIASLTAQDQRGQTVRVGGNTPQPTVVYFYPSDGTPGCTAEACAFRDVWKLYQEAGINVIGVSNDDQASHANFAKEQSLPFSLVADTDSTWARVFGVPSFAGFYSRITFLVGPNGVVLKTYNDVDPGIHAKEILADAQSYRQQPGANAWWEKVSPATSGQPQAAPATSAVCSPPYDPLAPAPRPAPLGGATVGLKLGASLPFDAGSGVHKFWLGVTLTPPAGSHLYWKHPGETGLATRVEFTGPEGFAIGEVQYPGPLRFTSERGHVSYGYAGAVTIVAEVITRSAIRDASFQVHGSWLSCDVRCVKEEGSATVLARNGSFNQPFENVDAVLEQLPQPNTVPGMRVVFDASTQTLGLSTAEDPTLKVVDVFPEQDLGPDDRVPQRLTPASGFELWHWRAALPPTSLLVHTLKDKQHTFYRLVR